MTIECSDVLTFLQSEISNDFEIEKKLLGQFVMMSKQLNVLVSWKPHDTELIVTISQLIQDKGQQYSIHLIQHKKWTNLLKQWLQKMIPYLLNQNINLKSTSAQEVAQIYCNQLKNIKIPDFEDPDNEKNYAISKLGNIELEYLNLIHTKQSWFEINIAQEHSKEDRLVRQISVPVDVANYLEDFVVILDQWLQCQLSDLNQTTYIQHSKKNYSSQILVIGALFICWLIAVFLAPS